MRIQFTLSTLLSPSSLKQSPSIATKTKNLQRYRFWLGIIQVKSDRKHRYIIYRKAKGRTTRRATPKATRLPLPRPRLPCLLPKSTSSTKRYRPPCRRFCPLRCTERASEDRWLVPQRMEKEETGSGAGSSPLKAPIDPGEVQGNG